MNKKIKLIICSLCLLFVVLLVVILCLIFKYSNNHENNKKYISGIINLGDIYYDSSLKNISSKKLSKEHCSRGVCISNVSLKCSNNYGVIYYNIIKKEDNNNNYGVISFNTGNVYIDLTDLEKGKKKRGTVRFRYQNLSQVEDYKFVAYNNNNVVFAK